jgi:hypothetical protein
LNGERPLGSARDMIPETGSGITPTAP